MKINNFKFRKAISWHVKITFATIANKRDQVTTQGAQCAAPAAIEITSMGRYTNSFTCLTKIMTPRNHKKYHSIKKSIKSKQLIPKKLLIAFFPQLPKEGPN